MSFLLFKQLNLLIFIYLSIYRYFRGQEVGRVRATDSDGNFITYSLVSGDTNRYFIDNSGVIYVTESLIGNNDNRDSLIVMASDSGNPPRNATASVSL